MPEHTLDQHLLSRDSSDSAKPLPPPSSPRIVPKSLCLREETFASDLYDFSGEFFARILTFDFSLSLIMMAIFSGQLPEGRSKAWLAALGNIQTFLNITGCGVFSFFYPQNSIQSELVGKLQKQKDEGEDTTQKIETQRHISLVNQAGWLVGLGPAAIAMLLLGFSEDILLKLHQTPEVARLAGGFLKRYGLIGLIPAAWRVVSEFTTFIFNERLPGITWGLSSMLIGGALAYLLAFGKLGHTPGVNGLAEGYAIGNYVIFIMSTLYILIAPQYRTFQFGNFCQIKQDELWAMMKEIIGLGIPSSFNMMLEMALPFVMALIALQQSVHDQAVLSLCLQLIMLGIFATYAGGMTGRKFVSHAMGLEDYAGANRWAIHGLVSTLIWAGILLVMGLGGVRLLLSLLGNADETLVKDVMNAMGFFAVGVLGDAVRYQFLQQLSAFHYDWEASAISWAGLVVTALLAWGGANVWDVAGEGAGFAVGMWATAGILGWQWIKAIAPEAIQAAHENYEAVKHLPPKGWYDSVSDTLGIISNNVCSLFGCGEGRNRNDDRDYQSFEVADEENGRGNSKSDGDVSLLPPTSLNSKQPA